MQSGERAWVTDGELHVIAYGARRAGALARAMSGRGEAEALGGIVSSEDDDPADAEDNP